LQRYAIAHGLAYIDSIRIHFRRNARFIAVQGTLPSNKQYRADQKNSSVNIPHHSSLEILISSPPGLPRWFNGFCTTG
jgi:hypothetical protein